MLYGNMHGASVLSHYLVKYAILLTEYRHLVLICYK